MNSNLKAYEKTQADGLNQQQLIVMMYNGISRYLLEAKKAINNKDNSSAQDLFEKARKIVFHLLGTLNPSAGEITNHLMSMYTYFIEKITEANMKKDPSIVDEIVPLVDTIREGWESIKLNDESIPAKQRKLSGNPNQQVSIVL